MPTKFSDPSTWLAILGAFVLVGVGLLSEKSKPTTLRPFDQHTSASTDSDPVRVEARLWQDPIAAAWGRLHLARDGQKIVDSEATLRRQHEEAPRIIVDQLASRVPSKIRALALSMAADTDPTDAPPTDKAEKTKDADLKIAEIAKDLPAYQDYVDLRVTRACYGLLDIESLKGMVESQCPARPSHRHALLESIYGPARRDRPVSQNRPARRDRPPGKQLLQPKLRQKNLRALAIARSRRRSFAVGFPAASGGCAGGPTLTVELLPEDGLTNEQVQTGCRSYAVAGTGRSNPTRRESRRDRRALDPSSQGHYHQTHPYSRKSPQAVSIPSSPMALTAPSKPTKTSSSKTPDSPTFQRSNLEQTRSPTAFGNCSPPDGRCRHHLRDHHPPSHRRRRRNNSPETVETRLRSRYAVNSALHSAGYRSANATSLGYIPIPTSRKDGRVVDHTFAGPIRWIPITYEIFRSSKPNSTHSEELPASGPTPPASPEADTTPAAAKTTSPASDPSPSQIVIFWIDSRLCDVRPDIPLDYENVQLAVKSVIESAEAARHFHRHPSGLRSPSAHLRHGAAPSRDRPRFLLPLAVRKAKAIPASSISTPPAPPRLVRHRRRCGRHARRVPTKGKGRDPPIHRLPSHHPHRRLRLRRPRRRTRPPYSLVRWQHPPALRAGQPFQPRPLRQLRTRFPQRQRPHRHQGPSHHLPQGTRRQPPGQRSGYSARESRPQDRQPHFRPQRRRRRPRRRTKSLRPTASRLRPTTRRRLRSPHHPSAFHADSLRHRSHPGRRDPRQRRLRQANHSPDLPEELPGCRLLHHRPRRPLSLQHHPRDDSKSHHRLCLRPPASKKPVLDGR